MNELFRNTLGPAAWTAIALVPPAIFALYFLRLRREPLEVPSTYLWTKVIEDLHVNSLWQKLRRNLLLLLQLLLVGLAILALLRPGWQGDSLSGRQFIFLIDRSASMSTADVDAGTRLAAAKRRAGDLIDEMDSDMSAMIIAFDDRPDVVQEFTSNRRRLHEALERIEPSSSSTDVRGALELAAGFANPQRQTASDDDKGTTSVAPADQQRVPVYILSDGRFAAVENFALGNLEAKYLPIGSAETGNLAITAFNARRNDLRPEQRQAFVQLVNLSDAEQSIGISLLLDGKLRDAAEIRLPAGDAGGATFNLGDIPAGKLEARLDPPANFIDKMTIDNRGYAALDKPQTARVLLVSPGNRALELGLSTERVRRIAKIETLTPDALAKPDVQQTLRSEAYDLVIFDQCAPAKADQMPLANTLFIGRLPPLDNWRTAQSEQAGSSALPETQSSPSPASDEAKSGDSAKSAKTDDSKTAAADQPPITVVDPQIIDWQRSHPLLDLVELGNVRIVDSLIARPPLGGKILVDSTKGPLLSLAPRDSYEDVVLGFEIVGRAASGEVSVNTNWRFKLSFPNFCLNVVQYLAVGAADIDMQSHAPGSTVELEVPQRDRRLTVILPNGVTRSLAAPEAGKLAFHETDQLGVYDVMAGDQLRGRFAVNLFDREESDVRIRARQDGPEGLQTVQALTIGYDDVAAESAASPMRKELWTALLLAVLVVLVLEWYIYNRRVYV
jgi:hypothetical protein